MDASETLTPLQRIEKVGANAYRLGWGKMDCPYYLTENMPFATNEPISQWLAKSDAWERGWMMERAMNPTDKDRFADEIAQLLTA